MTDPATNAVTSTYGVYKSYSTPALHQKTVTSFDRQFWEPARCTAAMSVLEVGCGTGVFLLYLKEKGIDDFHGIDQDPDLLPHIPPSIAENFSVIGVWPYLEQIDGRRFDRIVLFDVLEHFSVDDGLRLLKALSDVLSPDGRIVVRVPNAGSPWGLQHQFGDLTHRATYTPVSLRQLAIAAGLMCSSVYPHISGSRNRRILDRWFHGALNRVLMSAPEIWSANFLAVMEKPEQAPRR